MPNESRQHQIPVIRAAICAALVPMLIAWVKCYQSRPSRCLFPHPYAYFISNPVLSRRSIILAAIFGAGFTSRRVTASYFPLTTLVCAIRRSGIRHFAIGMAVSCSVVAVGNGAESQIRQANIRTAAAYNIGLVDQRTVRFAISSRATQGLLACWMSAPSAHGMTRPICTSAVALVWRKLAASA